MPFDSNIVFGFLQTDYPRESYHYTNDGYLITVFYDEDNRITIVVRELV